jgi:hypothetical protein
MTLPTLAEPIECSQEEPAALIAGDTWTWRKSVADYKAGDGWSLKYRLVPADGGASEFTATADGDAYQVSVPAATTAGFATGSVAWFALVSKGADRVTVDQGRFTIRPNPATATTAQMLSHARKVLAAIEAVLETRATRDQEEYQIEGRSLKRTPLNELVKFRSFYRSEVRREEQAEDLARGRQTSNAVVVRFN